MEKWELISSILISKIDNHYEYVGFCKQFLKYSNNARTIKNYLFQNRRNRKVYLNRTNKDKLLKSFPFLKSWKSNENILAENLNKKYKNNTFEIFPFNWLKNEILRDFEIDKHEIKNLEFLSGIISKDKLKEYVQNLLPYSFILQARIKLKSSYFSRDDDEFYLIQNPCLKEKVFKVPMVRGSGWKGALAKAAKEFINEDLKNFESFVRIFGTGSQEYREVIESIEKDKNIIEKLVKYALFELGLKLTKDDIQKINSNPKDYLKNLSSKLQKEEITNTPFLQVHKGRAVFYPTYFNKLSLEIINPHSRKTRAGTNPIHYEVVPEDTEGTLQIVYIPYDAVLREKDEIENEVKADIEFLTKCIEKVSENGIGAKAKLGWGGFGIENGKKIYCLNQEIDHLSLNGWKICEVKNG